MPSITSLLAKLTTDYPAITFVQGDEFHWSPADNTVTYCVTKDGSASSQLLHELSHALLGHTDYSRDITLLKMERDAWEKAQEIAVPYGITITDEIIQNHLDTYRDWLHDRSTCPTCGATGLQSTKDTYRCVACTEQWRVNEAKTCELRRYKLVPNQTKNPA